MASVRRPVLVGQLTTPLTTQQQHIGWLQITMHDAVLVSEVDGTGKGSDELGGAQCRLRFAGEPFVQAAALDVFKAEKRRAAALADLMDLHDVRMRQTG